MLPSRDVLFFGDGDEVGGGLLFKAAGLPPVAIDAIASIEDMWAKGAFDITTGDVARLAGRAPRRLIDVAKEYLAESDQHKGELR